MRKQHYWKYGLLALGVGIIAFRMIQQNVPSYHQIEVILDAGHGGYDSGAVYGGMKEKDLNLMIAHDVRKLLEQQDIKVHMVRYKDEALGQSEHQDLKKRVQFANQTRSCCFVSIHMNASKTHTGNGFEIYTGEKGDILANHLFQALAEQNRIAKRKIQDGNHLYVLRNTKMQSVLVEVGYLDGAKDQKMLRDPETRKIIAEKLAKGILLHLQEEKAKQ